MKSGGPSTPVEVLGLTNLPQPGDSFQAVADAAKARQIAAFRQTQAKERALGSKSGRLTLESLKEQIAEGGIKELPIIVKADVQGSAEVLADTLTKLSDDRVKIRIIRSGVGAINESDVLLASASNAIVIGFNVRPDRNAADVAEREEVDVRLHSVIYNVTDEIKKGMEGMLEPTMKEVRIGTAEVREVFKVPKIGAIAGCLVTEGRITRQGETQARLLRDNVVVHEGKIGSLRRFKDDVSEVKNGMECGIGLDRFNDIKVGDVIEVVTMERVAGGGHVAAVREAPDFASQMRVAVLEVELFIPYAHSLKEKRMVVKRVVDRLGKFNVAVAEVAHQDVWQRAGLGIVAISTSAAHVEQQLAAAAAEIDRVEPGLVSRTSVEFLT